MEQLGVFAKYWAPGGAKTRLAATLGSHSASRLAETFLATTLTRLADLDVHRVLAYSPPDRTAEFARLAGKRWTLEPQASGDLGQRMESYFATAFARGRRRVVLVGADSPTLPVTHVQRALWALSEQPVVLTPAADGGYCLVGLARPTPELFREIAWSTGEVLAQTEDRLTRLGLGYLCLPPWYDVDDEDDLYYLQRELRQLGPADSCWQALVRVVDEALREGRA